MFKDALARISADLAHEVKLEQDLSLRTRLEYTLSALKTQQTEFVQLLLYRIRSQQELHEASRKLDATRMCVEELCESLICQYEASERLLEISRIRSNALQNEIREKEITIAEVWHGVSCTCIVCNGCICLIVHAHA